MLAIRMQRTGRKGHAQFRVVVQDSRLSPVSGRVVALLGSYDPHTKQASLSSDKADFYLKNGAQPSPRVARLLTKEGIKVPEWVKMPAEKQSTIRNPEKLRRNRPESEAATEPEPAYKAEAPTTEVENKTPAEDNQEPAAAEQTAESAPVPAEEQPEPIEVASETSKEPPAEKITEPASEEAADSTPETPENEALAKAEEKAPAKNETDSQKHG